MTFRLVVAFAAEVAVLASAPTLHAQSPTALHLTRDLRIDAVESDLTLITPPGGMAVAPNGTIVVSQNQDGMIRFFDPSGKALGAFGRRGQGPGEFQQLTRLMWSADTLAVSDQPSRRLTLISPDRKLIRTVPWLSAVSMPSRSASEAPRFLVSAPRVRYTDGGQLVTVSLATGSPAPAWPGGEKEGVPLLRVDSAGAFQRLIGWSPRRQCNSYWDSGSGMGSGTMPIPFCAQTMEEVTPDGAQLIIVSAEASTPSYRVVALRENGDTVFNRSYRYQPSSIPQRSRDSARALRARGSQSQRDAAAAMPIPESYPPLARVVPGRDYTTWLELYGQGGTRTWQVLDTRGAVIGTAVLPPNIQVMVTSRDVIWGIETDNDGLQHIVRYRVSR